MNMKIESPEFGALEVDADKLIEFPHGMPGFEQHKRFALVHDDVAGQPIVFRLQSLDDPNVAFSVTDPALFGLNYELTLTDHEAASIGIAAPDDAAVAVIVRKNDHPTGATNGAPRIAANLLAPIVINTRTRRAIQQVISRAGCEVTLRSLH